MLSNDAKWYTFQPPHWSNVQLPLTRCRTWVKWPQSNNARKYRLFLQARPSRLAEPLLKLDEKARICKKRSENFLHEGGSTMTTQAVARRRCPRGTHPKGSDSSA